MTKMKSLRVVAAAALSIALLAACQPEKLTNSKTDAWCAGPTGISGDGRYVLLSNPESDGPVSVLDRTTKKTVVGLAVEGSGGALSRDGGVALFFDGRGGRAMYWVRATGERLVIPTPAGKAMTVVGSDSVSADGRYLVFGAIDGDFEYVSAYVFDRVTKTTTAVPGAEQADAAMISGNGRFVAYVGADGFVRRWDRTTGTTVTVRKVTATAEAPLQDISADGRFVAVGDGPDPDRQHVRIWDATTGSAPLAAFPNNGRVISDALDFDGTAATYVVTSYNAQWDATIYQVNRATGARAVVNANADGALARTSDDGSVVVYCAASLAGNNVRYDVYAWLRP